MNKKEQTPQQADTPVKPQTYTIPLLTDETDPGEVVRNVLKKCLSTLNEDIDALNPKDRIMLWKEYNEYFGSATEDSDIPGMNIREVKVNFVKGEE